MWIWVLGFRRKRKSFYVHILGFFFRKEKRVIEREQLVQDRTPPPSTYLHMCTLYRCTNTYMPRFTPSEFFRALKVSRSDPWAYIRVPHAHCVCVLMYTHTLTYTPTRVSKSRRHRQHPYVSCLPKMTPHVKLQVLWYTSSTSPPSSANTHVHTLHHSRTGNGVHRNAARLASAMGRDGCGQHDRGDQRCGRQRHYPLYLHFAFTLCWWLPGAQRPRRHRTCGPECIASNVCTQCPWPVTSKLFGGYCSVHQKQDRLQPPLIVLARARIFFENVSQPNAD